MVVGGGCFTRYSGSNIKLKRGKRILGWGSKHVIHHLPDRDPAHTLQGTAPRFHTEALLSEFKSDLVEANYVGD